MPTADRVHAAEGLFAETPEGPRLLGSRCAGCGTPYFPRSEVCHNPDCDRPRMEDASFGPRGTIWSCAIQNYPPPSPALFEEPYQPYAMGAVDLPEGLRVMGRIHTRDPEGVRPGLDVELVVEPVKRDDEGRQIVTWMFRPL